MRWIARLLAAATLLAVGLTFTAGTANADTPPLVMSVYGSMTGLPNHVALGGTFAFNLTWMQRSSFTIDVDDLDFGLWDMCRCSKDDPKGAVATYRNPLDGAWHTAKEDADSFQLDIWEPGVELRLASGEKMTVPVRITFGPTMAAGTYELDNYGASVGNPEDATGAMVDLANMTWNHHDRGEYKITVGSSAPPRPDPKGTTTKTATTKTATTKTAIAKPNTVSSPHQAAPASPATSPAPVGNATPGAIAAPSVGDTSPAATADPTLTDAALTRTGSEDDEWIEIAGAIALLCILAMAVPGVRHRLSAPRRR